MPAADQLRTLRDVTRDVGTSLIALRRNTVKHSPRPPQTGWVLDVGSGQAPNLRSDLIVDKYVADDFERGSPLVIDKPLVVADGHALPFAPATFAYVIASHVLEHATDRLGRVERDALQHLERVVAGDDRAVAGDHETVVEAEAVDDLHRARRRAAGGHHDRDPGVGERAHALADRRTQPVPVVHQRAVDVQGGHPRVERHAMGSRTSPRNGCRAAGRRTEPSAC